MLSAESVARKIVDVALAGGLEKKLNPLAVAVLDADIDRDSQNLSAATLQPVLTERTRAIVCVHLAGWPCDMETILSLVRELGIFVIEDCAQAHGATYRGRSVGTWGHINAWSFWQNKIMTTGGEGGMVTTDDHKIWEKAWSYKDHGKSWDAIRQREYPPGFRWLHETFGTNWRMIEMQAAIGRIQLDWMRRWHEQRTRNAEAINAAARSSPALRAPEVPNDVQPSRFMLGDLSREGFRECRLAACAVSSRRAGAWRGQCRPPRSSDTRRERDRQDLQRSHRRDAPGNILERPITIGRAR